MRPPKSKKGISKKNHEPIIDNNVIYRYEDDPEEYKKAKKFLFFSFRSEYRYKITI
jgi:hypothetical protein